MRVIAVISSRRFWQRKISLVSLEQDLAGLFDKVDLAISSVKDESERQLAAGIIERNVLNGFIARQLSRQSDLDSIRVTNNRGDIIYGTDVTVDAPFNAARRQVFMRLRDDPTAGLVISEPVVGQINGKWLLAFGRRVNQPDGKFAGVVYGTIALELLQKKFAALDLGRHGVVSLRDLDLGTVVRYPDPRRWVRPLAIERSQKNGPRSSVRPGVRHLFRGRTR